MPRNSPRAVSGRQEAEEAGEKKLEQDGEPLESWQRSAGRGTPGGAGDAGSALLRRPPRLATAPPGTAPAPAQLPAPQAHPDHPSERRGRARGAPQNRNWEPGVPAGRVRPREDVLSESVWNRSTTVNQKGGEQHILGVERSTREIQTRLLAKGVCGAYLCQFVHGHSHHPLLQPDLRATPQTKSGDQRGSGAHPRAPSTQRLR